MTEEYFVTLGTMDKSRFVIKDPETTSFKKGKDVIETTKSKVYYLNDEGVPCELYFNLADQLTPFGFSINHKYGTAEEDQKPETQDNMQVCYPLTSMSTKDEPTNLENQTKDTLDIINEVLVDTLKLECEKEDRKVPAPTFNAYCGAERKKNWDYAIKPIYGYPTKKEGSTKTEDRTKPQRAYIKLLTKGKGKKMRCETQVYGPGDNLTSAFRYVSKSGMLECPVYHLDTFFWGAHGKASYGGSAQIKLVQCNYKPRARSGPKKRYTLKNTAPPAEVSEESEESSETDTDYHNPKGDKTKESEGFSKSGDDDDPQGSLYKEEEKSEENEETEEDEDDEEEQERKKKEEQRKRRLAAKKARQAKARRGRRKKASEE